MADQLTSEQQVRLACLDAMARLGLDLDADHPEQLVALARWVESGEFPPEWFLHRFCGDQLTCAREGDGSEWPVPVPSWAVGAAAARTFGFTQPPDPPGEPVGELDTLHVDVNETARIALAHGKSCALFATDGRYVVLRPPEVWEGQRQS